MAAEEHAPRGSGGSERFVSDRQRGRLLTATFALVGERGYEGVSARSVSERAGVSNRTFYECFSDREDCFLAAFNHARRWSGVGGACGLGCRSWVGRRGCVRALAALLLALDREPAVGAAGVRRGARGGSAGAGASGAACWRVWRGSSIGVVRMRGRRRGCRVLVAEGVVGATFGVIHARLLELRPGPLIGLLGSLMATIVLPYRGSAAAAKELERPSRALRRRHDGGMAMVSRAVRWGRLRRWTTG